MKQSAGDLLETLQQEVGCLYVSDLRLCPEARRKLCCILTVVPLKQFPIDQWREAYRYLTGEEYRGSSESLPQRLIQKLQGPTGVKSP